MISINVVESNTGALELLQSLSTVYSRHLLAEKLGVNVKTIGRWLHHESNPPSYLDAKLRELADAQFPRQPAATAPWFKYVDLFAGIGGFRKALDPQGGQCVFTSEWDVYCQKTYRANYKVNHPLEGDIRCIEPHSIPDHDLLVAGFPCQPFSIAGVVKKNSLGRQHGFLDETQGTLFFNIAKILQAKRPRAFILENVRNLLSHDRGRTFCTIMDTLKELGYDAREKIISASHWVPQKRQRLFIVGFSQATNFTWDDLMLPPPPYPALESILHRNDGSESPEPPYTEENRGSVSAKYTLSGNLWKYLKNYASKHRDAGNGFGYGLFGPKDIARTLSARYYKDGSEILIRRRSGCPRRLTPRECARLMGFDQFGQSSFKIVVSDTQAYKQFGNAVVPSVVQTIASQIVLPPLQQLMQNTPLQYKLNFTMPSIK